MPQLHWLWAVDQHAAGGGNRTQAGIVAAVRGGGSSVGEVTVYGVVTRGRLGRGLECSFDDGATWHSATRPTVIPEADLDKTSFTQRYNHRWPPSLAREDAIVEPDTGLTGSRFICGGDPASSSSSSSSGATRLSVRHKSLEWRIDGVQIHPAGYPIVSDAEPASAISRGPGGGIDITVCVQYVYGSGYSRQAMLEHAAWYLLLGARRIVTFDSLEPENEPIGEKARIARERMEALHQISRALGPRFIVVRGLATWDVMRRTRLHMSAQSLAGTLCRSAAAGLASSSTTSSSSSSSSNGNGGGVTDAYVILPDLDEFISPPISDAYQPRRIATHLAGALRRLVKRVDSGQPVTSHYLNDAAAVSSRVHYGGGTRRCLSFASVYYYLPTCSTPSQLISVGSSTASSSSSATATSSSLDGPLPTILRRSWRGQPDNFEEGPSHNWTYFPVWNFWVRSKYLVSAHDEALMTGNHECCCKMAGAIGRQCTLRTGGLGNHTCATLEFMPLEHWHVRHYKGLGSDGTCRRSDTVGSIQAVHPGGARTRVSITPIESRFPESWTAEYMAMLQNLTRLVDEHAHNQK